MFAMYRANPVVWLFPTLKSKSFAKAKNNFRILFFSLSVPRDYGGIILDESRSRMARSRSRPCGLWHVRVRLCAATSDMLFKQTSDALQRDYVVMR